MVHKRRSSAVKDASNNYFNYSPIYSMNESREILEHDMLPEPQSTTYRQQKVYLYKRAASQQSLLSKIPRQEYQDTPETFLQPLMDRKNSIQNILIDNKAYKCFTSTSPKFQGIQTDHEGRIISRKMIGNEEMYREGEGKVKNIMNLKLLTNKNTMRSMGGLANKNKIKQHINNNSNNLNDLQGSNQTSVQGAAGMAISTISEEKTQKTHKHKSIKFPDQSVRDLIGSIQDRMKLSQNLSTTQLNFNNTGITAVTNLTRVSTIGSLLKEIKQERVLKQHQETQMEWEQRAFKINKRIFDNSNKKPTLKKLKKQNTQTFQSVMMRDKHHQEKVQLSKGVNHLRDLQHMNQNVGWIFSLRQSDQDDQRKSQQYLPSCTSINAVIVPKRQNIPELFVKPKYSSDEEDDDYEKDLEKDDCFEQDQELGENYKTFNGHQINYSPNGKAKVNGHQGYYSHEISRIQHNNTTIHHKKNVSSTNLVQRIIPAENTRGIGIMVSNLDPNTSRNIVCQEQSNLSTNRLTLKDFSITQADYINNNSQRKLFRISSQPSIQRWQSYKQVVSEDKEKLQNVMICPNINELKRLRIRGRSKLINEVESCIQIPENTRRFILNHQYTEDGIGEPVEREEIIAEYYENQYGVQ
ncbi:UNKNOWN [Stylonychia lemnae]|uniref:Uncharacterized protein n=1 Tax=Stylonychia lemnae TaxID=5949 RepID=A0A078B493_STYLE|nr:UNKNOWN [Stylonychia lemnae]|eukprot:CDW88323.1 UNKNOWN [Stylonychia lemnae]